LCPPPQLYAYLKRLGYIIQRKSLTESLRTSAALKRGQTGSKAEVEVESIIADPRHPLRLVTILDLLLYPLRRISQLSLHGFQRLSTIFNHALQWLRSVAFRTQSSRKIEGAGRGLLGIGGRKWDRYEDVFDRLRIVPSGHDHRLRPRLSKGEQQPNDSVPEIFFYAWRPATRFKKTDPPLPEYRLAVVDARETSLPSVYAFESLFKELPIPINFEDLEDMEEEEQREWKRAQEEKKRNDESYGKGAVKKQKATIAAADREKRRLKESQQDLFPRTKAKLESAMRKLLLLLRFINHWYTLLPPGCTSAGMPTSLNKTKGARPRPLNVFPPLKAGRRSVIVAINDCGTSSLLRFGEAEFERWRLAGSTQASS
jgi:tRNA-splicing endonuclease subunit Sen54